MPEWQMGMFYAACIIGLLDWVLFLLLRAAMGAWIERWEQKPKDGPVVDVVKYSQIEQYLMHGGGDKEYILLLDEPLNESQIERIRHHWKEARSGNRFTNT